MSSLGKPIRSVLAIMAAASCLGTVALPSLAQGLPGLTIFSGIDRANQLGYRLDNSGRPSERDRYRLRIPPNKMTLAVAQLSISYPNTYQGTFDPDNVEVRVEGDTVPLDHVEWDQENRVINIYPVQPIPARTRVEVRLSNVHNPIRGGTHYFNAMVRSPGDLPMLRYVGTWIVNIGEQ